MNVLYTCDCNYIWLMSTSMISLFKTNRNVKTINVYLIGENISDESKEKLVKIANDYGRKCIIIDLPEIDLPEKLYNSSRWPKSAYTRLFSAQILPSNVKQVLYLDCDTIVKENIEEIFNSCNEKVFYGVKDCIGKEYKQNIGLLCDENYINAGVLVINLDKLRNIDVFSRINIFLEKYEKYINYADQDVLNAVFNEEIGIINPKYDVMTIEFNYNFEEILKIRKADSYYNKNEIVTAVNKPFIIHYTTNMLTIRPWYCNSNHPRKEDFIKIYNENNYFNKPLKKYTFSGTKNRIMAIVLKMPKFFRYEFIGLIHGYWVPIIKRWKGSFRKQ